MFKQLFLPFNVIVSNTKTISRTGYTKDVGYAAKYSEVQAILDSLEFL